MGKKQTIFICNVCQNTSPQWQGKCHQCGSWDSFSEQQNPHTEKSNHRHYAGDQSAEIYDLSKVEKNIKARISSGMVELDRVLGGGVVPGSVILVGGDPGVGKSTLILQWASKIKNQNSKVLYVSGEESPEQVAIRAERMGLNCEGIGVYAETRVESILQKMLEREDNMVIIDSIQTMHTESSQSAAGSVSQVRESALALTQYAKSKHITVVLIGHMTKDGHVAGPRVLEHMVDTVLTIEGEKSGRYRLLRAVKNRFGDASELGVFAMCESGMKEVKHPSLMFLSHSGKVAPGSAITAIWEGSRAFLLEIQALVDEQHGQEPRRLVVGFDQMRLNMLLAIMHKHAGMGVFGKDIYVNIVGGMKITETSADLAIALAICSSLKNKPLPKNLLILGELGLNGEIRPIAQAQARVTSAAKHGLSSIILAKNNKVTAVKGANVFHISHIKEAFAVINKVHAQENHNKAEHEV